MTDETFQDRLAQVLAEWDAARARGEAADPEAFLAAHPDLAEELAPHLVALELLDDATFDADASQPALPEVLGEYRILHEIARGGMGVVYEAEQSSMGRHVALKVLNASITGAKRAVQRFQVEARAAGSLHHTNIVPVYGMGQHAGYWYYAMELIEGRPLSEIIRDLRNTGRDSTALRQKISGSTDGGSAGWYRRVAEMFAGVADALQAAHDQGIVHRDVKPSNLLLDKDGELKVVDFGLAHLENIGPSMTITGDLLGTPAYMSPEQAMAKRVDLDHRTDVYSLGATLYEVLTLLQPFSGRNLQAICSQIITKDPALPRHVDAQVPRDLETIVVKAMEKDRDKRYATAGELARDLRRFSGGEAVKARRIGPVGRAWRKAQRHKLASGLSAALLLAFAVGSYFIFDASVQAKERHRLEYDRLLNQAALDLGGDEAARWAGLPSSAGFTTLTEAIELDDARSEAWWLRVFARSSRGLEEQFADIEAAGERGLSSRACGLMRAYVFTTFVSKDYSNLEQARREYEKAGERISESAVEDYSEARVVSALSKVRSGVVRGEVKLRQEEGRRQAIVLLDRALDSAHPHGILHFMALRQRSRMHSLLLDWSASIKDKHALQAAGDTSFGTKSSILLDWFRLDNTELARVKLDELLDDLQRHGSHADWVGLVRPLSSGWNPDWAEFTTALAVKHYPDSRRLLLYRNISLQAVARYDDALAVMERALDAPMGEGGTALEIDLRFRRRTLLFLFGQDRSRVPDGGLILMAETDGRSEELLAASEEDLDLVSSLPFSENERAHIHKCRLAALTRLGRRDELPTAAAEARAAYESVAHSDSVRPATAAYWRGDLLYVLGLLGDYEGARAEHRRYAALHPDDVMALNAYAWFCVDPEAPEEQRDVEAGLEAALQAAKLSDYNDVDVLDSLAWALFQSGDTEQAVYTETLALELLEERGRPNAERVWIQESLQRFKGPATEDGD